MGITPFLCVALGNHFPTDILCSTVFAISQSAVATTILMAIRLSSHVMFAFAIFDTIHTDSERAYERVHAARRSRGMHN